MEVQKEVENRNNARRRVPVFELSVDKSRIQEIIAIRMKYSYQNAGQFLAGARQPLNVSSFGHTIPESYSCLVIFVNTSAFIYHHTLNKCMYE